MTEIGRTRPHDPRAFDARQAILAQAKRLLGDAPSRGPVLPGVVLRQANDLEQPVQNIDQLATLLAAGYELRIETDRERRARAARKPGGSARSEPQDAAPGPARLVLVKPSDDDRDVSRLDANRLFERDRFGNLVLDRAVLRLATPDTRALAQWDALAAHVLKKNGFSFWGAALTQALADRRSELGVGR